MAVTAHGGKRHVMVPAGRFMAENDTSWTNARMAGIFFAQSSALITYLLIRNL
jgi:hypothetical protein